MEKCRRKNRPTPISAELQPGRLRSRAGLAGGGKASEAKAAVPAPAPLVNNLASEIFRKFFKRLLNESVNILQWRERS